MFIPRLRSRRLRCPFLGLARRPPWMFRLRWEDCSWGSSSALLEDDIDIDSWSLVHIGRCWIDGVLELR